jgi:hypothetical protein
MNYFKEKILLFEGPFFKVLFTQKHTFLRKTVQNAKMPFLK